MMTNNMNRLAGKVAVVTGGASGMGEATVRKFVAEGARVVLADLQREKGQAIAEELGACVTFVAADVAEEEQVRQIIETALAEYGRLDCLFNNAGFAGVNGDIDSMDMGEPYRRTVDCMMTGVLSGMKHAVPHMKAAGGSILTTASVAGLKGGLGPHVYSAVKCAVINLTRSVALEVGQYGIRVNAICPGGIATPIFAGQLAIGSNEDFVARVRPVLEKMQPIPRAGEPEDIANAACFLASDEAAFITGHALVVDGGLTAGVWTHPELAPGAMGMLAQMVGVESLQDLDMVFHAPES